jgi:hypothetical protein
MILAVLERCAVILVLVWMFVVGRALGARRT